jgi:hypothetical protein
VSVFHDLIEAQRKVMAETGVNCGIARLNAADVMELREHSQFQPIAPNPTSCIGYVFGIEIKVDNNTRQGWVNLHGPGLDRWMLVRLGSKAPSSATAWDKIGGDDLV